MCVCFYWYIGEKFRGLDFRNFLSNEAELQNFRFRNNTETKFFDIGILKGDHASERTVELYPKGKLGI